MQIYSHPFCLIEGKDFPGKESAKRFDELATLIGASERAFKRENPIHNSVIERIKKINTYLDDLRFKGNGILAIDAEEETFIDKDSLKTVCANVATCIAAADNEGFALIRPPGHHAHRDYTHGFCLVNNMAITVDYLLQKGERVAVLDLDIHHGCGTEELLQDMQNAEMLSIYKSEIWPGKSHYRMARNCVHVPIQGTINDDKYKSLIDQKIVPFLNRVKPSIVGISLGFDTFHIEEFGWNLTGDSLRELKSLLANQRHFCILEGGYTHEALQDGLQAFVL